MSVTEIAEQDGHPGERGLAEGDRHRGYSRAERHPYVEPAEDRGADARAQVSKTRPWQLKAPERADRLDMAGSLQSRSRSFYGEDTRVEMEIRRRWLVKQANALLHAEMWR